MRRYVSELAWMGEEMDNNDGDDDDGDDDDDHLLSKEKGKEGRVSREDGAMSSQRVGRRDNRHVRDEHRLAYRLHHVPEIRCNVAQTAVSRLFLILDMQEHSR